MTAVSLAVPTVTVLTGLVGLLMVKVMSSLFSKAVSSTVVKVIAGAVVPFAGTLT